MFFLYFFNDTASTEIITYCHTLSLHYALPISADHRDRAERTLQKMRPLDPFDEFFGQYLGIEQILGVRHGPQRPDRDRIVGCDEAQGLQSGALHPLGD